LAESDIASKSPRIPYLLSDKHRYYYPDFYIPKINLLVEIKSCYTAKLTPKEKAEAAKSLEYNYITIIDNDFDEFDQLVDTLVKSNK
jgi:hypothetical protein